MPMVTITKLDEQVLVSLNSVFDRGQRVDRVLQLLFMGSFAFVAIFKRCLQDMLLILGNTTGQKKILQEHDQGNTKSKG